MKNIFKIASWGATPGALKLRRRIRFGILCGSTALLMVGCLLPHLPGLLGPAVQTTPLVDLDEDGLPEQLRLLSRRDHSGSAALRLVSTNHGGHDHLVAALPDATGASFTGAAPRWVLKAAAGPPLLEARLVRQPGRPGPDLLMVAGERAWRWVHLEKGFLKLDALEIVPGFSVGLLMVGDHHAVVEAIGGAVSPGGTWQAPLRTPLGCSLAFDGDDRLKRITTASPRLRLRAGHAVGQPLAPLANHYPGKLLGDGWSSPRYGLAVRVDGRGAITGVTVQRPWPSPDDPSH